MVSFSCDGCQETMVKKKVGPHVNWCGSAVTCIDCGQTFDGQTFKQHNQCMTEEQKYQGKLYRPKPVKGTVAKPVEAAHIEDPKPVEPVSSKKSKKIGKTEKKTEKSTEKKDSTPIRVTKTRSLKKILKDLRKEHKLDEKDLLEKIKVTPEGQILLS